MKKWLMKLKLFFFPPRRYQVYKADAFFFIIGRPVEKVMHGLKDKYGTDTHQIVLGEDSYRFMVHSTSATYYILDAEVLVKDKKGNFEWKKRVQRRRIPKETFINMIVEGTLRKD